MASAVFHKFICLLHSWLRFAVCALLFGFQALASQAQQQNDHLVPNEGPFTSYSNQSKYYSKVRETVYAGLSENPVARLVVLPSFEPECVFSIDQKGNKYYLTYNQALKSIWSTTQAQSSLKVEVETKSVEISKEAATTVGELFNMALDQVRYPAPVVSIRGDGTTYTFIAFRAGNGLRSGKTWSPSVKTKMATLVAVAERLKELAATPTNQQLELDLIQQTKQLTTELRAEK